MPVADTVLEDSLSHSRELVAIPLLPVAAAEADTLLDTVLDEDPRQQQWNEWHETLEALLDGPSEELVVICVCCTVLFGGSVEVASAAIPAIKRVASLEFKVLRSRRGAKFNALRLHAVAYACAVRFERGSGAIQGRSCVRVERLGFLGCAAGRPCLCDRSGGSSTIPKPRRTSVREP
eukprot:1539153-Alexandrium_andersonii.AAC.1